MSTPEGYRAVLTCRRCGALRYVPAMAEKFTYWICLPMRKCGTMNVWR
jgi:hypothetical protein